MKKVLIIKTGTILSAMDKNKEDLDDFIINQTDISKEDVIVTSVYRNESLPEMILKSTMLL